MNRSIMRERRRPARLGQATQGAHIGPRPVNVPQCEAIPIHFPDRPFTKGKLSMPRNRKESRPEIGTTLAPCAPMRTSWVLSLGVLAACGQASSGEESSNFESGEPPTGDVTISCSPNEAIGESSEDLRFDVLQIDGDVYLRQDVDAVVQTPSYSPMYALNAGTWIELTDDRLILHGDDSGLGGDGATKADLVLYENSGFTRGYIRGLWNEEEFYSTVNCTVAPVAPIGRACSEGYAGTPDNPCTQGTECVYEEFFIPPAGATQAQATGTCQIGDSNFSDDMLQNAINESAPESLYMSESDFPYETIYAEGNYAEVSIDEALVRELFSANVELFNDGDSVDDYFVEAEEFAKFKAAVDSCVENEDIATDAEYCENPRILVDTLNQNLRGLKVFYFGQNGEPGTVTGIRVTIIVVGRTEEGNLAGVRTVAVWT